MGAIPITIPKDDMDEEKLFVTKEPGEPLPLAIVKTILPPKTLYERFRDLNWLIVFVNVLITIVVIAISAYSFLKHLPSTYDVEALIAKHAETHRSVQDMLQSFSERLVRVESTLIEFREKQIRNDEKFDKAMAAILDLRNVVLAEVSKHGPPVILPLQIEQPSSIKLAKPVHKRK